MSRPPLLRTPIPPSLRAEWAEHLAQPQADLAEGEFVVMIFRIGSERLALPIEYVREVADAGVIRPLPHARDGLIQGITNIHGQITVCMRIEWLLRVLPSEKSSQSRLLVLVHEDWCVAAMVDEVIGVKSVSAVDQQPLPSTHSGSVYSEHWLKKWDAALLDARSFMTALRQPLR